MGMTTIVFVSAISALEVIIILRACNKHWLKVFLGHKTYVDIVYGLGFTIWAVLQGSVSAFVIASISGFIMTLVLSFFAGLYGTRRKVKQPDGTKVWVEYAPTITMKSVWIKFCNIVSTGKSKYEQAKEIIKA